MEPSSSLPQSQELTTEPYINGIMIINVIGARFIISDKCLIYLCTYSTKPRQNK